MYKKLELFGFSITISKSCVCFLRPFHTISRAVSITTNPSNGIFLDFIVNTNREFVARSVIYFDKNGSRERLII